MKGKDNSRVDSNGDWTNKTLVMNLDHCTLQHQVNDEQLSKYHNNPQTLLRQYIIAKNTNVTHYYQQTVQSLTMTSMYQPDNRHDLQITASHLQCEPTWCTVYGRAVPSQITLQLMTTLITDPLVWHSDLQILLLDNAKFPTNTTVTAYTKLYKQHIQTIH